MASDFVTARAPAAGSGHGRMGSTGTHVKGEARPPLIYVDLECWLLHTCSVSWGTCALLRAA